MCDLFSRSSKLTQKSEPTKVSTGKSRGNRLYNMNITIWLCYPQSKCKNSNRVIYLFLGPFEPTFHSILCYSRRRLIKNLSFGILGPFGAHTSANIPSKHTINDSLIFGTLHYACIGEKFDSMCR